MAVPTLGRVVNAYEGGVTRRVNAQRKHSLTAWQSRCYDYIIRNEDDMNRVRGYIHTNPARWHEDDLS